MPDVSFVAVGRTPSDPALEGFVDLTPDLVIEVLSPGDHSRDVLDKVGEYLQAGVRLIWIVDPKRRSAVIYRSLSDVRQLAAEDSLDGEDVVPGFGCPLKEVVG